MRDLRTIGDEFFDGLDSCLRLISAFHTGSEDVRGLPLGYTWVCMQRRLGSSKLMSSILMVGACRADLGHDRQRKKERVKL